VRYFRDAFTRNAGLRIDHFLLSPVLRERLQGCGVDKFARAWEPWLTKGGRFPMRCPVPGTCMNTWYGLVDTPEAPDVGAGVSPSRPNKPTSASGSKEGTTTEPIPVSGK
jgi:hypothetical protein